MSSITSWNEDNRSHFRLKSRDILERLVKKFSYEIIASYVPDKHKKLISHIRKMVDRQRKKKKQSKEKKDASEEGGEERKPHKPRLVGRKLTYRSFCFISLYAKQLEI